LNGRCEYGRCEYEGHKKAFKTKKILRKYVSEKMHGTKQKRGEDKTKAKTTTTTNKDET
jgi:hypothetical protein